MNCPLCQAPLAQMPGTQSKPNDATEGVTVWCSSHKCPAQEVFGHGANVKQAYQVVLEKYKPIE